MKLTPDQMSRILPLFEAALALEADAVPPWLDSLGPDFDDLLPALRAALERAPSHLDGIDTLPRIPLADPDGTRPALASPGDSVGPYQLVRVLGNGGMAEVWLAERSDGAYRRSVALKLPLAGGNWRDELAARFANERDILAGLEHPGIARFYDAGTTAGGISYLAMEFVPGQPITEWCDEHQADLPLRLALFLDVLGAVQYAHDHQVIHRDLKPSNILVTNARQVRLLDFGVAKLLAPDASERSLTKVYGRALTPAYASPELLQGKDVEATSDVYSLGVLLQELLSGSRPRAIEPGSAAQLQSRQAAGDGAARTREETVAKLATARATTPRGLARSLRGDLDAIVRKAVASDPGARYSGAAAMAEDLRRHLAGKRVSARRGGLAHGATLLVRQHPGVAIALASAVVGFALFAIAPRQVAPSIAAAVAPTAPGERSVAVLPFVDMSKAHDQEYFSDGLTEELIDRLARMADLKVISRTSCFQFKGRNTDIREIAARLGVANVVEGSVRKSGNALRVTVQLIRATDGSHLWSHTYDKKLSDIFQVQDDIAGTVATRLQVALSEGSRQARGREPAIPAYNLVLEGGYFLERGQGGDDERAVERFRRATASDPGYALAWAKLAGAYLTQAAAGELTPVAARERAMDAVQRALALDPELAKAHTIRGQILRLVDWDYPAAAREFERAIALDPEGRDGLAAKDGLLWLAASRTGRLDDVIAAEQRMSLRDPLNASDLEVLGTNLFWAGRLDESARVLQRVIEINPAYANAQAGYGTALLFLGRDAEALAAMERETDEASRLAGLALVHWKSGRRVQADAALESFERRFAGEAPYAIAEIRGYRGEADPCFAWLERAYAQRDPGLQSLRSDPFLRGLRDDPRTRELLARLKLDAP
jgi:TolB-like protein/tetratricopeptide (TPR) repeat protein